MTIKQLLKKYSGKNCSQIEKIAFLDKCGSDGNIEVLEVMDDFIYIADRTSAEYRPISTIAYIRLKKNKINKIIED
jgi:hypothetical protein